MGEKGGIKVLVVDDEKITRSFFVRLLCLMNLEVTEAESGNQAVELVKGGKAFDLFFIDVNMPGLDGLETFRQIHQITPEAPVIMMTGYSVDELLKQAQKEGAQGVIRKPFDIGQIKDIVGNICKKKTSGPLNLLAIDDEGTILKFFSSLFKGQDVKYTSAQNRLEALAAVGREKFDLIFLDLVLKETNGMELYKEIKAISPEANIVLMTGYPQKAKELDEEVKLFGFLSKPFEVDEITKCIDKIKEKK